MPNDAIPLILAAAAFGLTVCDSELEQVLCFDSAIDAERFASEKSAIFLILPEEDSTKNFMAGLLIQTLSRELFAIADEHGALSASSCFSRWYCPCLRRRQHLRSFLC